MILDFTKDIVLDKDALRAYRRLRFLLFFIAFLSSIYLSYLILFPPREFSFSFGSLNSNKNSIDIPRHGKNEFITDDKLGANDELIFDNVVLGTYSEAVLTLNLGSKSDVPEALSAKVTKSYKAFLYPKGEKIGFKDGSLLMHNKSYYLVSRNELRHFKNTSVMSQLGFSEDKFDEATEQEIAHYQNGPEISDPTNYPDYSLFLIDGNYYMLQDQSLKKFSSVKSFLSQYSFRQAIAKDQSFLQKYGISSDIIGFSDGSLISYGDGAYVVSGTNIFPIDNPTTFTFLGFNWDDLIPASADEISLYERGKLLNINAVHPNGTIYRDTEKNTYYKVSDGKLLPIISDSAAESWLKKSPVLASEIDDNDKISCNLKKVLFRSRTFECRFVIDPLNSQVGKDYEFSLVSSEDIRLDSLDVTFKKKTDAVNLKATLLGFLNRIRNTYAPVTQTAPQIQTQ